MTSTTEVKSTPDRDTEAFNHNGSIEEYRRLGKSHLGHGKERRASVRCLRCTFREKKRPKAAIAPEKKHVTIPGIIPALAIA
jgi:hypothetical protein